MHRLVTVFRSTVQRMNGSKHWSRTDGRSVPDQVAAKIDFGAWFATLTKRMKEIAKDLAFGCSTSEVARQARSDCRQDQPDARNT